MRITVGSSRTSKKWLPRDVTYKEFINLIRTPTVSKETLTEFLSLSVSEQAALKDVGGFVGGTLNSAERKTTSVAARSIVTLDADNLSAEDLVTLMDRLK